MGTMVHEKIREYIEKWESRCYKNGIPDEAPTQLESRLLVPSYRIICIALMRNHNNLELLGIPRPKCKIYSDIKRNEIYNRVQKNKQLNLFM